jgi:hypothetical protein
VTCVGWRAISPVIVGRWPPSWGFPERVRIRGLVFRRARWTKPYAGVVAQYREETDHDAMHLKVRADGHYVIDHVDEANPDRGLGLALEHVRRDMNR